MDKKNISNYQELISLLPQGNITYKKINGKVYPYYQWVENGKQRNRVVKKEELEELIKKIEERKEMQRIVNEVNSSVLYLNDNLYFSSVFVGDELKDFVEPIKNYKKRNCYNSIIDYVYGNSIDKVFILYGLRRTGKTTLIKQVIASMDKTTFDKAAFVQLNDTIDLYKINSDLRNLYKQGYKYIFIDEVTMMNDFISSAALFSDIYASKGMKIVLTGTDSLGFVFSLDSELYDRSYLLHTTFIPYREFVEVLGINGIDNYIQYGGTMSMSGVNYNSLTTFNSKKSTDVYIDSAIAHNIQHSLQNYKNGNHFRNLSILYEADELTNVINRVVEHENKKFTIDVLTKTFESSDFALTAKNLIKDKNNLTDILYKVDKDKVTKWLMKELDIIEKKDMKVTITQSHVDEIKEYLRLLDLIIDIEVVGNNSLDNNEYQTVITQPGMRYAIAKALIDSLIKDKLFDSLSIKEKKSVTERLLSTIKGKMMEDIVLLESKMAHPECEVFKLKFAVGEFDMVIFDPNTTTCEIYEVKYGQDVYPSQYQHLIDSDKLKATEFRYGDIKRRCVIYNGSSHKENDIEYINVDEYLSFKK